MCVQNVNRGFSGAFNSLVMAAHLALVPSAVPASDAWDWEDPDAGPEVEGHAMSPTWSARPATPLDEQELFAVLRAGAAGYLPSGMDPQRLSHTLSRVLDGEVAIPRALVARLVEEFRDGLPQRRSLLLGEPTQLTSREWQVLDLLRDGHSTSEIAQRLVLAPVTVRTHINAIVHKLGYAGRDELLRDFSHA